MMKYSIILPYIDRLSQLERTLRSFVRLYDRDDFEIIIVEDYKNSDAAGLFGLLREYKDWLSISQVRYIGKSTNPAPLYNLGVGFAAGQYLVLSSPECLHKTNILAGLDEELEKDSRVYVVCACESLNANNEFVSWYQHSIHRNAMYHFCSAICKQLYLDIGGFDNAFGAGYCFDDDDFKVRVLSLLDVVVRDDLVVAHQWHSKKYVEGAEKRRLWNINKKIYESKHGIYIEPIKPAKERVQA